MRTLVYINPLKAGKLKAYKAFVETITGPRKVEYIDLLNRYGLRTAKVFYHKVYGKEYIVVMHDAEEDALERLEKFAKSENAFDHWFYEQLAELHDFDAGSNLTKELFTFDATR